MIHKLSTALLLSSCAMFLIHLPASADWRSQDVNPSQSTYRRVETTTRRNRNRPTNICKGAANSDYDIKSLNPKVLKEVDALADSIDSDRCVIVYVDFEGGQTALTIHNDYIRWSNQNETSMRVLYVRKFGKYTSYAFLN